MKGGFFFFSFIIFCDVVEVVIIHHPSDSLAKFGYKHDMKSKKFKKPSHFLLHARTQWRNLKFKKQH
jgi:pyoverdine/dityrosine biosynthesis protein Dit1